MTRVRYKMEAVKNALEGAIVALKDALTRFDTFNGNQLNAIQICYDALESLENSEPVGEMANDERTGHCYNVLFYGAGVPIGTKLYITPQQMESNVIAVNHAV